MWSVASVRLTLQSISAKPWRAANLHHAAANFGSDWTWLVKKVDGSVDIVNTSAAGNPLTTGDTPLLNVDVWEHAYYINYRNQRPKYLETFVNSIQRHLICEGDEAAMSKHCRNTFDELRQRNALNIGRKQPCILSGRDHESSGGQDVFDGAVIAA